jgi:O-antigen/teichoic acid export membrane protein
MGRRVSALFGDALARSAAASFLVNAAALGMAMAVQVIFARWLGPAEYGIYAFVTACLALLIVPALGGLDTASLRFVAAYNARGERAALEAFTSFARGRVFAMASAIAAALVVLAIGGGEALGTGLASAIIVGAMVLPLNGLVVLRTSVLQASGRAVSAQAIQGIVRPLMLFALLAFLFVGGYGLTSAVALGATGAVAAVTLAVLSRSRDRAAKTDRREQPVEPLDETWIAAARQLAVMSAAQAVLLQADVVLLGMMSTTTEAGAYSVASRLATIVSFGITAVNAILAPRIAALYVEGRHEELQSTVRLASVLSLAYAVPVVIVLAVTGHWLLTWFGPGFTSAYPVLLVLAAGQLAIVCAGSVGFLMTMTGHEEDATGAFVWSAATAVLGASVLIPRFGAMGAALGTVVGILVRTALLTVRVRRRVGIVAGAAALR